MQWIKATERLPEFMFPLVIKFDGNFTLATLYDEGEAVNYKCTPTFYFDGKDHFEDQFSEIEWLDENYPSFTLDDAIKIWNAGCIAGIDYSNGHETQGAFSKFIKENYPNIQIDVL